MMAAVQTEPVAFKRWFSALKPRPFDVEACDMADNLTATNEAAAVAVADLLGLKALVLCSLRNLLPLIPG